MDLRIEIAYPAGAADVAQMLADEAFHTRVAEATGALSWGASVERLPSGGLRTRLHRVMPPDVPDFVRRFVGDSLDVVETTEWQAAGPDGARAGTVAVEIARTPVQLTGRTRLDPTVEGSRQTIDAVLTASVPFVGGKIEEAAAEAVRTAARKHEEVAAAWLRG